MRDEATCELHLLPDIVGRDGVDDPAEVDPERKLKLRGC